MLTTEDFEFLLDRKNVIGVSWEEDEETLYVTVSKKMSEDELGRDDIVSNALADEDFDVVTEVEDAGLDEEDADGFPALRRAIPEPQDGGHRGRVRPARPGASEINASATAGTASHYPFRVVDTSKGEWSPDVSEGDMVRLSNNHVYARSNKATFDEEIIQPSGMDGGNTPDDVVGTLAGYAPIEDGVTVDAAFRTTGPVEESGSPQGLGPKFGKAILRELPTSFKGAGLIKSGRTTGVTQGEVKQKTATVNVAYGGKAVKIRDCIIATGMSEPGDSGSPVYVKETGELVGLLFAGSSNSTIMSKVSNVEEELGVEAHPRQERGEGGGGTDETPTASISLSIEPQNGTQDTDPRGRIVVNVNDGHDAFEGAQVIATSADEEHVRLTDQSGKAVISGVKVTDYTVEASAIVDGVVYGPSKAEITAADFTR
jgi:hypothetical protein